MIPAWFHKILLPSGKDEFGFSAIGVYILGAISALSLAIAPLFMPESYSWISNTTSESAAQGIQGAWLARLGFLSFGLAVIWLAVSLKTIWARGAVWMHTSFGVIMAATAAFSTRAWMADVPFDPVEDWLHSFTATAMGFAFTFGIFVRLLQRDKHEKTKRLFDVVAIAASIVIPLLMLYQPVIAGLLQRGMFVIAYLWYGNEALLIINLVKKKINQQTNLSS